MRIANVAGSMKRSARRYFYFFRPSRGRFLRQAAMSFYATPAASIVSGIDIGIESRKARHRYSSTIILIVARYRNAHKDGERKSCHGH